MPPLARFLRAAALAAAVLGGAGAASADDVPISEDARRHFAAGVALLEDPKAPRYEEAYREFKLAYAASPSYRILGNLGLCAMKIERDTEAVNAYETYLAKAGLELTPGEREQIERDLATLKAGLVEVAVSSDPPGALILDVRTPVQGLDVRNAYGQVMGPLVLGLRRGHHVITARLAGYVDQQWEFDTTDAVSTSHLFTMVRPVEREAVVTRERPVPTAALVVGTAAVALAAGGTVVGILALDQHAQFERENTGSNPAQAESARSAGQALNAVTDVLFAGALVGAGITAYLVVTRPTVDRRLAGWASASAPAPLLPTVTPMCGPHEVGGSAAWTF